MDFTFQNISEVRKQIEVFGNYIDDDKLMDVKLEDLISFLSQSTKQEITNDDLKKVFYLDSYFTEAWSYILSIRRENESLERIGKIIGMSVSAMPVDEIKHAAMKLFMLSESEYKLLAEQKGIPSHDDKYSYERHSDSTILPGLLMARGSELKREEIRQKILEKKGYGFGYLDGLFKNAFSYFSKSSSNNTIQNLYSSLQTEKNNFEKKLDKHLAADKELTGRHTIAPPEFLPDKTLKLNIMPYAIDFTLDGRLAVLGGKLSQRSDDPDSTKMILNIYDINKGKLLSSINTGIHSQATGGGGFIFSLDMNLNVGEDGIIYVNGGSKRYSADLEELTGNESNFKDAINVLRDNDLLPAWKNIFQIAQSEGVFYFAIRANDNSGSSENRIAATDGKKIIGTPLTDYSPDNSGSSTDEDITPRIVIHGNELYFKKDKQILAVDRSLTENAWKKPFIMVETRKDHISEPIPSKHCISKEGILYAVRAFEEEAVQSIHGYSRGAEKGEFATHIYPVDCHGGWATTRSMAIDPKGILAYSSWIGNKIHFYQLAR